MHFPAALVFSGRAWLWPAVAGWASALGVICWGYRGAVAGRGVRMAGAGLKGMGVTALLFALLEPAWSGQRAKPGANVVAVVADNSESMTLKGSGETESRGEALRRTLSGEAGGWRAQLAETFEVRNFLADSRVQPALDFRGLTFSGRASALGETLRLLAERNREPPLAAIVLLTDGLASDLAEGGDFRGLPPVYPVIFGAEEAMKDLAIVSAAASQTSFEDAPVTVEAEVSADGFAGEEITATLTALEAGKADGKPIAEQSRRAAGKAVFRFQFRPEKTGVLFYRLRISPKAGEATVANNETIVTVDRGSGPHRVLYVAGRPNWEYKFLHRALEADDQTQLVGLLRIAKREAKFEFRGRAGESSNPLFRGFGNQSAEEVERYDRPVLLRMNTRDERELSDGFPKTAEELFEYRAVILDDVEAAFFAAEQMSLVQRFVSERGGGLLMLGGAESFADGGFQRTAIGETLPIYLDRKATDAAPGDAELRLALTREGWLQPWVRLRATEPEERTRMAALPAFDTLNGAGGAKPAAIVAATVRGARGTAPALVTQRFGRGRTAALLVGDQWHAGLGDEARSADLAKGWRQLVRWLVADVPEALEVRTEAGAAGGGRRIAVRVRDRKFQALDDAGVTLTVQRIGAEAGAVTLAAEASATEAGLYEATYFPRESGGYRVEAAVSDASGVALGKALGGWSTELAGAEFRSLTPNRALMETVARQTGGRVLAAKDLAGFAAELPARRAPVVETWTRPLWHTPFVFVFALGCFVAEWGVRRWKGLA